MSKTKVVNKRNEPYDVYIGRGSNFGNPFTHIKTKQTKAEFVVKSRKEAIEAYRSYLLSNPELLEEIKQLKGKTLGCFCKPKSCHGDIIVEVLESKGLF